MEEIEEIMDDEPFTDITKVINDLKKYLVLSNILQDIQKFIESRDYGAYMSIGINRRRMNSQGKYCIALFESGAGSLLSPQYDDNGVIYIHTLDLDTGRLSLNALARITMTLALEIINYLSDEGIIRSDRMVGEGSMQGYAGIYLYRKILI